MSSHHRLRRGLTVPAVLGILVALILALISSPVRAAAKPKAAPAATGFSPYSQGTPPVACDHTDAPDKGWIQIFYVYRDGANHLNQKRDTIRRFVWDEDQLFEASARRFGHGDSRRLRFVQDADCQITVTPIGVSLVAQPTLAQGKAAADKVVGDQIAKGDSSWFNRHKTIYIFDVDGIGGCGVGGGGGLGNMGGGFASLAPGCWGAEGVEHEMGHSFGLSHCNEDHTQGNDPMCRSYDPTPRCSDIMSGEFLDCPNDEFAYFNPRPAPGSVLDRNPGQNIANSPYLIKDQPAGPVDAQVVDVANSKCLASGGEGQPVVEKACGSGDVWRRTIASDGYYRLEWTSTKQCLSSTPAHPNVLITQACADGDHQQHWKMDDSPDGPAADFYAFANEARKDREGTKERIDNGGSWQYSLHFSGLVQASAPSSSTTSQPAKTVASSGKPSAAQPTTAPASGAEAAGTVTAATSPSTPGAKAAGHLAKTGSNSTLLLTLTFAGIALIGSGIVLMLRTRRQRAASSASRGH